MTATTLEFTRGQTVADDKARPIGKTRVQFDLSPRAMALLTGLKAKTDAATDAEAVRTAMKLYDGIIAEMERGHELLIRDKDGKVTAVRMFL